MTATLEVTKREERGKALKKLRKEGKIPGVMYGPKEDNVSITVDAFTFEKVLREAGESSIIVLEGLDEEKEVLVQAVEFDPIRGGVSHVDFYAIERGKELTVNVPIEFEGEAPALKLGGNLMKALHDVEVTCLPRDLPKHFVVDTTVLEDFESSIHVKDLKVGEGVTINNNPDDMVASVVEAVEEEEPEVPEEVDMDSIEVEQKGKDEEGGDEAPAEGGDSEDKG